MKTLRWLIVFIGAAIVAYLLLSTPRAHVDGATHIDIIASGSGGRT